MLKVRSVCKPDKEHYIDAAFQWATFEAAGLLITRVAILHLDCTYRRNGACDPHLLFNESDCTEEARAMLDGLWLEMAAAAAALADAERPEECGCHRKTKNSHCDTFSNFHPEVPEHGSIYELTNLREKKLNAVLDTGVLHIVEWPDSVDLTPAQQTQLDVYRDGQRLVDNPGLTAFMEQLQFPLYFLDYEACQTPAPLFEGCWPYQQVPFQYSLHILEGDGSMIHCEYLATEVGQSPIGRLAERLASQIGPLGSLVVWHATFERGRNQEMATAFLVLASFFLDLNARMIDLKDAVSRGLYVHPEFRGSASIKHVLPVMAPNLSYKTLAIGDGMTASQRWRACRLGEISGQERDETYAALREYCHLDTLAMVGIWQHLNDICDAAQVARGAAERAGERRQIPTPGSWSPLAGKDIIALSLRVWRGSEDAASWAVVTSSRTRSVRVASGSRVDAACDCGGSSDLPVCATVAGWVQRGAAHLGGGDSGGADPGGARLPQFSAADLPLLRALLPSGRRPQLPPLEREIRLLRALHRDPPFDCDDRIVFRHRTHLDSPAALLRTGAACDAVDHRRDGGRIRYLRRQPADAANDRFTLRRRGYLGDLPTIRNRFRYYPDAHRDVVRASGRPGSGRTPQLEPNWKPCPPTNGLRPPGV